MARILVIEDEPQMRATVARILVDMGHQVSEAKDGVEGMKVFNREPPDLVLTDIIMPEKEGIETIVELRRKAPDTRIVAMSGGGKHGDLTYLRIATAVGADAVIAKPFRSAEMAEVVERVLAHRPAPRTASKATDQD